MDISINTPALLFPAIAILMLGYINRYLGTANVIRNFRKDYDTGYIHVHVAKQLGILKQRLELSRYMISIAICSLMLACASMLFIFLEWNDAGTITFGASIVGMITSLCFSLLETTLSNKSLLIEVHDILDAERKKMKG